MKVQLWNDYRNYVEIINLEYGRLSKEQIQENKDKWTQGGDFAVAVTTDNIFSPYEKKQVRKEWDDILRRHDTIMSQVHGYWQAGFYPVEVTTYDNSYKALYEYLFVKPDDHALPLLAENNMEKTSTITKQEYDTAFVTYYDAYKELAKLVAKKAQELADEAIDLIDGVKDNIVFATKVYSSHGELFKNGNIDTTLYARLYHGKEDITEKAEDKRFSWRRVSTEPDKDTEWNVTKGKEKKTIHITRDDVRLRATFFCDVVTDGL